MVMNAWMVTFGSLEGKRPFWRTRCRWYDNITTILHEISYEVGTGSNMDPWYAGVNTVTKLFICKKN